MDQKVKIAFSVLIPLGVWMMPREWLPIEGITVVEQRVLAIFAMAVVLWVLEPIPVFATSLLVVSDRGRAVVRAGSGFDPRRAYR